jgi:hypothetical protein
VKLAVQFNQVVLFGGACALAMKRDTAFQINAMELSRQAALRIRLGDGYFAGLVFLSTFNHSWYLTKAFADSQP